MVTPFVGSSSDNRGPEWLDLELHLAVQRWQHEDTRERLGKRQQKTGTLLIADRTELDDDGAAVRRHQAEIGTKPAKAQHADHKEQKAEGQRQRLRQRALDFVGFGIPGHHRYLPGRGSAPAEAPGPSTRIRNGAASVRRMIFVLPPMTELSVSSERSSV